MWRLALTVSLLCCSSDGSVTCRDENNGEVDWYILYKTPRIQDKGLTGLDYVYIYPAGQNNVTSQPNKKLINDPNGILANTLHPLFTPPPNFGFISYNDQPPDYMKKSVSSSYGHSKGVVMVQKNRRGVWLLHSTPHFPYKRDKNHLWPESGASNAQTFICVTFNYDQFEHIGKHLQYIRAYPFDHHIPSGFYKELQDAAEKKNPYRTLKTHKKPKVEPDKFQQLVSSGGKKFYSIAKQRSSKVEVGDLYVTISEKVNSDVDVQSWGRQHERDGPFCPTNGEKVQNIESVKTGLGEWDAGDDHSKWCVAVDQNKPWTCIADVNRAKTQYKRPGGALCVKDAEITNIFKSFAVSVEGCSGPRKHGH